MIESIAKIGGNTQLLMATFLVNVNGAKVKTTVTNTTSFVDSFVTELVLSCNYSVPAPPIIGFDVNFIEPPNGTNSRPATLQLCSGSRCIIVQLNRMGAIPQSLLNLLSAPLFCFAGVEVHEKLSALRREYSGFETIGIVLDLKPLLELAVFTGCVEVEPKPMSVVMANWGAENLEH